MESRERNVPGVEVSWMEVGWSDGICTMECEVRGSSGGRSRERDMK